MKDQSNSCQTTCWIWAAATGIVVAGYLLLVSHLGLAGAAFLGLMTFGLLGGFLVWGFCKGREIAEYRPAPMAAMPDAAPVVAAPVPAMPVTAALAEEPAEEAAVEVAPATFADLDEAAPAVEAEPAPVAAEAAPELAEPGAEAELEAAEDAAPKKPRGLKAPRKAGADDLKKIEGVGPKLEEVLNGWGIWHYDQIAKWGAAEVAYADQNVPRFKGRCTRDKWVAQAKIIVEEGLGAFLERAKTNDY